MCVKQTVFYISITHPTHIKVTETKVVQDMSDDTVTLGQWLLIIRVNPAIGVFNYPFYQTIQLINKLLIKVGLLEQR